MHPLSSVVRQQLSRLTQHSDFRASARLKAFLTFIVEETLAGRAEKIKAYTIALEVFKRGVDFDPLLDSIVRVEAGKLRKHLEYYYTLHPEDSVHITIPSGSYIPLFNLSEKAQENRGKSNLENFELTEAKPCAVAEGASTDFLLISEANLSAGQRVKERNSATPFQKEARPLLAILPFDNSSQNLALKTFIVGLRENLLVAMYQNDVVDVMEAPASALGGQSFFDVILLAKQHNIRFLLHGQVQHSENFIRLYGAITDTYSGRRIWTEKFDSPFSSKKLPEIQDEVAQNMAAQVTDSFGVLARFMMRDVCSQPIDETDIYKATLLFYAWSMSFDCTGYQKVKQALEGSLGVDPENPLLHALLSDIYASDYQLAYNTIHNNLDLALELAKRALALDNSCRMGQLALALNLFLRRDKAQLEAVLNNLLPLANINPYACASVGLFVGMAFDLERGKEIMEAASSLNPYKPSCYHVVPYMYWYSRGEYEQALKATLQINAPNCIWDPMLRVAVYGKMQQKKKARKPMEQLLRLEPSFRQKKGQLLQALLFDEKWIKGVGEGLDWAGL